jgi:hypothetical protein
MVAAARAAPDPQMNRRRPKDADSVSPSSSSEACIIFVAVILAPRLAPDGNDAMLERVGEEEESMIPPGTKAAQQGLDAARHSASNTHLTISWRCGWCGPQEFTPVYPIDGQKLQNVAKNLSQGGGSRVPCRRFC